MQLGANLLMSLLAIIVGLFTFLFTPSLLISSAPLPPPEVEKYTDMKKTGYNLSYWTVPAWKVTQSGGGDGFISIFTPKYTLAEVSTRHSPQGKRVVEIYDGRQTNPPEAEASMLEEMIGALRKEPDVGAIVINTGIPRLDFLIPYLVALPEGLVAREKVHFCNNIYTIDIT